MIPKLSTSDACSAKPATTLSPDRAAGRGGHRRRLVVARGQRRARTRIDVKFSVSETICPPSGSSLNVIEVIMMLLERELHARRGVEALGDRLALEHRLLDLRDGGVVHEDHVDLVDVAVAVRLAEARRVERDDADHRRRARACWSPPAPSRASRRGRRRRLAGEQRAHGAVAGGALEPEHGRLGGQRLGLPRARGGWAAPAAARARAAHGPSLRPRPRPSSRELFGLRPNDCRLSSCACGASTTSGSRARARARRSTGARAGR